jgi:transcriptional regulator with XRE-family HTH domain
VPTLSGDFRKVRLHEGNYAWRRGQAFMAKNHANRGNKTSAFSWQNERHLKIATIVKLATNSMKVVNLVGRQIGRLRYERGWTQEELADKLFSLGWEIDRSRLSKIEGGTLYVPDFRLFYFAQALGVEVPALFPRIDPGRPIHQTILKFIHNEHRGLVPEAAPAAAPIAAVLLFKGRR